MAIYNWLISSLYRGKVRPWVNRGTGARCPDGFPRVGYDAMLGCGWGGLGPSLKLVKIRHLPFLDLTDNLTEKIPSDFQMLLSNFGGWEFWAVSLDSDGGLHQFWRKFLRQIVRQITKRKGCPITRTYLQFSYFRYITSDPKMRITYDQIIKKPCFTLLEIRFQFLK